MEVPGLHIVDWIIFAVMLAISSGIGKSVRNSEIFHQTLHYAISKNNLTNYSSGLYHSFTGDKQMTTPDYLSGGKSC